MSRHTFVFDLGEARTLLDSIDISKLIGLMVYSFVPRRGGARHGGRGCLHAEPPALVRLREKGGMRHVCRATPLSKNTAPLISMAQTYARIPKGRCFARSGKEQSSSWGTKLIEECYSRS